MLEARPLALPGGWELRPPRVEDERGFFSETWSRRAMAELGLAHDWVQENQSRSRAAGTLRGLHFQLPPADQAKLVRVSRGRAWSVAVELRPDAGRRGAWVGVELSDASWNQFLIPAGCAHGFVTLEPDTDVQYRVTAAYAPELERTIRWDDPDLAIAWPAPPAVMSPKDRAAPTLAQFDAEARPA